MNITSHIEKGNFLISKPLLNFDVFNQSVIILADHTDSGSVGFLLNVESEYDLSNLVQDCEVSIKVFKGGPVEIHNLYYLHSRPDLIPDSVKVSENIYWGGDFDTVIRLVNEKTITEKEIRFFLGYSGWGEDQLQSELEDNSWIMLYSKEITPMRVEEDAWQQLMKTLGGENLLWANAPKDPIWN